MNDYVIVATTGASYLLHYIQIENFEYHKRLKGLYCVIKNKMISRNLLVHILFLIVVAVSATNDISHRLLHTNLEATFAADVLATRKPRNHRSKDPPCLKSCDSVVFADTLQKCVDRCFKEGHCCGNRHYGQDTASGCMMPSCANGCEIAFFSSKESECKGHCAEAKQNCEYKHPFITDPFEMCDDCDCDKCPSSDACNYGCEQAKSFEEFYQHDDVVCDTEDIPRFLFAGQSNMEGHTEEAKEGLFTEIVDTIKGKDSYKKK